MGGFRTKCRFGFSKAPIASGDIGQTVHMPITVRAWKRSSGCCKDVPCDDKKAEFDLLGSRDSNGGTPLGVFYEPESSRTFKGNLRHSGTAKIRL